MTPAETIEAAIKKLTALRDNSTQDPWLRDVKTAESTPGLMRAVVFDDLDDNDAALVLTLHATIDAQLTILRTAFQQFYFTDRISSHDEPGATEMARVLASAILGDPA
jgi:hypothetical protein